MTDVWWAFVPQDDAGVFVPVHPWAIRSLAELPTEEALKAIGKITQRTVQMVGGEPGVVAGYLTPNAEFYVALPTEAVTALLEST
jgi:hypothetical protein